jgi:hypothetical protein
MLALQWYPFLTGFVGHTQFRLNGCLLDVVTLGHIIRVAMYWCVLPLNSLRLEINKLKVINYGFYSLR